MFLFSAFISASAPFDFCEASRNAPAAAPHFGIDNEPVLKETLGYDDAQVARLEQMAGAMSTKPSSAIGQRVSTTAIR